MLSHIFSALPVFALCVAVMWSLGFAGAHATAESNPAAAAAQQSAAAAVDPLHRPFDELLDLYVRDGLVYYRTLQSLRPRLDRYVASLDLAPAIYEGWSREQRAAFWVNAYNAFVIRTVLNHYPIRGRAPEYPADSIRQIPGAFDRLTHRAAGRVVTLDQIEAEILPEFRDPRLLLALGRGAVGSPRLKSEAYTAARLEEQLAQSVVEFATRRHHVRIDPVASQVTVTPILSWREAAFVSLQSNNPVFQQRSPIERAILALIEPHLLPREREFVLRNHFQVRFHEFDWRLNDLTGGPPSH